MLWGLRTRGGTPASGLLQFSPCVPGSRNCGSRGGMRVGLRPAGLAQSLGLVEDPSDACALW